VATMMTFLREKKSLAFIGEVEKVESQRYFILCNATSN